MRTGARLTQSELAEMAGLGNEFISKIERGKGTPSLASVERLSAVLKVPLRDLFTFDDGGLERGREAKDHFLKLTYLLRNASPEDACLIYEIAQKICKRNKRTRPKRATAQSTCGPGKS